MVGNERLDTMGDGADAPLTIIKHDFQLAALSSGHHAALGSRGWRLLYRQFAIYERNKFIAPLVNAKDDTLKELYVRLVAADQPLLEGLFIDRNTVAAEPFKNFVESDVQPRRYEGIGEVTLNLYNQVAVEKGLIVPELDN